MNAEWPDGKLGPHDEGAVDMMTAVDFLKGVVIIRFKKPVYWLMLEPEYLRPVIENLQDRLEELEAYQRNKRGDS